jgi:hypothetical protein
MILHVMLNEGGHGLGVQPGHVLESFNGVAAMSGRQPVIVFYSSTNAPSGIDLESKPA